MVDRSDSQQGASVAGLPPPGNSAPVGKMDRDHTRQRIKELIDEGDGFWRACSGCQEGEDGYISESDYPFDPLFRCQPGGGCSECGGIGVLWDDGRGYDDIAADDGPAALAQSYAAELDREAFKVAMVDAARRRGGAGAQFIADGHTNLWLDIAYAAALALQPRLAAKVGQVEEPAPMAPQCAAYCAEPHWCSWTGACWRTNEWRDGAARPRENAALGDAAGSD